MTFLKKTQFYESRSSHVEIEVPYVRPACALSNLARYQLKEFGNGNLEDWESLGE